MTTTVHATAPSVGSAPATGEPLLELRDLVKHFPVRGGGLLRRATGPWSGRWTGSR